MTAIHPLDQAIALIPAASGYQGRFTPEYGNMVGPFGGTIAAAMLNGVVSHPEAQGTPAAITVNFVAPIEDAPYLLTTRLIKTNRTNQHWIVELAQGQTIACTATVMMASHRDTWSDEELTMPEVQSPDALPVFQFPMGPKWLSQYEFKFVKGELTMSGQAQESSESQCWVKDKIDRPLDHLSLMALSDVFFPRSFVRKQTFGPAGTVSMTTYFHATPADLEAQGTQPVLGAAKGQRFVQGYFDQVAHLWSANGLLLASSTQMVYYK